MDILLDLLDPKWWLTMFGAFATIGVLLIVFAETGLLFGFFLPGDSLLVAAGIFAVPAAAASLGISPLSLPVLLIGGPLCAIAGAQLGHFLGAKFGRKLFDRPDSRLFKQEHVQKAEYYFEKFGPAKAVVLARFMPIVRTFLNPVAGVLGMDSRRFLLWNVVGGVLWIESMLLFGYFVGGAVKDIDRYILPGVFVIIVLSFLPIVREVLMNRKAAKAGASAGGEQGTKGTAESAAPAAPAQPDPFDLYAQQLNLGTGAPRNDPFGAPARPGDPNPRAGHGHPDAGPGGGLPGGGWPGGDPYGTSGSFGGGAGYQGGRPADPFGGGQGGSHGDPHWGSHQGGGYPGQPYTLGGTARVAPNRATGPWRGAEADAGRQAWQGRQDPGHNR